MQKTKKGKLTLIISVIAILGLLLVALTAVGITYTRYVSSSPSSLSALIPEWSFDLSSGDTDFNTKTSAKLHPDESVYDASTNNDRESLSIPIPVALLINRGDVNGDIYLNAYLDKDEPYITNERYVDNDTFKAEFSSHFIFNLYYSSKEIEISDDEDYDYSNLLTPIDNNNPLTLYSTNEADNSTTLNSIYLYLRVIWKSDINGNGDSFDSWVGRGIDKINIDIDCDIYQNGEGSIDKPTLTTGKLGVAYSATSWLYFDGSITSNHLGVTDNYQSAADVTVYEYSNGTINLAYTDTNGDTLYLASSENPSNTSYMSSSTDPYDWYYNNAYTTSFNGNDYFIGQYSSNQYLACYLTSNINNTSYRAAEIYTSEPTPEGVPSVDDPSYALGILEGETYRYFDGSVSSNHLNTTTEYDSAAKVYISEVSSTDIDNACTLSFYSGDTLEFIANSGSNSSNMAISTSEYIWSYSYLNGYQYFYDSTDNDRFIGFSETNTYFAAYASSNLAASGYHIVSPLSTNPEATPPDSISISGSSNLVEENQTIQLSVSINPTFGVNEHVIWSSSDSAIASVSEDGLVSALKAGEVTIKATSSIDSNVYGTYDITVTSASSHEYIYSESVAIADYYDANDSNGHGNIESRTITSSSGQVNITVDQNKDGGGNGSTKPDWESDHVRVYYGQTITFTCNYDSIYISEVVITATSSSYRGSDDATITDSSGNSVGSISKPSSATTLTLTNALGVDSFTYTNVRHESDTTQLRALSFAITYDTISTEAPTSITITDPNGSNQGSIEVGATIQLSASISPSSANNHISWSSDNESVVTVSQTGLLTGIAEGETTIKAASNLDSSVYGEYAISVTKKEEKEEGSESGDGYIGTITFDSSKTSASSNAFTTSTLQTCLSAAYSGTGVVTATGTDTAYPGSNGTSGSGLKCSPDCVQLGKGSGTGYFSFSISDSGSNISISKVVVSVVYYDSTKNLSVNETSISISNDCTAYSSWDDVPLVDFTISSASEITISSVTSSNGRMLVHSVALYS